jgi:predicted dehydrogenase
MTSSVRSLRWGILSTARIVRLNWQAMRESGAATLVALASRDAGKAAAFVDELQAELPWPEKPVSLGSYEELLVREDIDAVYIPLPTGIRKEWVIKAAEAGKHVLSEKPCAVGAEDLREMLDCCERHGVMFMDGVHFMHDERFDRLRAMIAAGEIGEVKRISSAFTYRSDDDFTATNIRAKVSLEPGGCLGDLGWYCLRASLWAMDWQMPVRVSARVLDAVNDADGAEVIMACSGELDFPGGATADFYCSFLSPLQKWLRVSGTAGNLYVPDFVRPLAEFDIDWELNHTAKPRTASSGLRSEARMYETFARAAQAEVPDRKWAEYPLMTQIVQDACMRSAALGRPVMIDAPL